MSHENKNIYTSNDGTKTGVHKPSPTAPFHVGTDTQIDGDTVLSGDATVAQDLTVNQNSTITGNQSIGGNTTITGNVIANKGVLYGDYTDTPTAGQVRWHNNDLEVWNGTEWKSLTQSGFELTEQMSFIDVPLAAPVFNTQAFTPLIDYSYMTFQNVSLATDQLSMESTSLQVFTAEANS